MPSAKGRVAKIGGKTIQTTVVKMHTPNKFTTYVKHIVEPDDNYASISLKYGVGVRALFLRVVFVTSASAWHPQHCSNRHALEQACHCTLVPLL